MKKAMVAMICVILVVAIGLVVTMGVVIGSGGAMFMGTNPFADLQNRQVFAAEDFTSISLSYSSDGVTIYPSQNGEVVVEEYASRWDASMAADVSTSDGRLSIRGGERPFVILGIFVSYVHLYLPAEWLGDLQVEAGSGSVKTESDFRLGSLTASSSSGGVQFASITADGDVSLRSSSGSVRCESITSGGNIVLETSSGGAHFSQLTPAASASVSARSGSVHGGSIAAGENITLTSNSGGVNVDVLSGKVVHAEASSGSVRCADVTADSFTGKSKSGGVHIEKVNAVFALESSSGSVKVDSGKGSGTAHTKSGGVNLTLQELTGDLDLSAGSGSVHLSLPMSTSMEFYAHTGSGSIRTPFDDSLSYNQKGNEARGTYGSGPDAYTVQCESGSGSVRVEWS